MKSKIKLALCNTENVIYLPSLRPKKEIMFKPLLMIR